MCVQVFSARHMLHTVDSLRHRPNSFPAVILERELQAFVGRIKQSWGNDCLVTLALQCRNNPTPVHTYSYENVEASLLSFPVLSCPVRGDDDEEEALCHGSAASAESALARISAPYGHDGTIGMRRDGPYIERNKPQLDSILKGSPCYSPVSIDNTSIQRPPKPKTKRP